MDKMKMLNDEELENVVGGVCRISITVVDGKIKIGNPDSSKCQNVYYLENTINGANNRLGAACKQCVYYQNGYCINQYFLIDIIDMEKSGNATVKYQ